MDKGLVDMASNNQFGCEGSSASIRAAYTKISEASPTQLIRIMRQTSIGIGANSMSYHIAAPYRSLGSGQLFTHFATGKALSRRKLSPEQKKSVSDCHDAVLKNGRATTLTELIPIFTKVDRERTEAIMEKVNDYGVLDEFLVPVYGPKRVNAVISFGFPHKVSILDQWLLTMLESLATFSHNRIVQHFTAAQDDIVLSKRENEILHWIARGKSKSEISTILELKPSSVDTYTRRIFSKLGVNDRVSAAVSGLMVGAISLQ